MNSQNGQHEQVDLRRRAKIMALTPDMVLLAVGSGLWFRFRMGEDVPADAEAVAATASFERGALLVLVRSASFAEVPEGEEFPYLGPMQVEYQQDQEAPAS